MLILLSLRFSVILCSTFLAAACQVSWNIITGIILEKKLVLFEFFPTYLFRIQAHPQARSLHLKTMLDLKWSTVTTTTMNRCLKV